MSKIVLTKSNGFDIKDIKMAVEEGLDTLFTDDILYLNSVIIKPNLCYYWDYSTGQTTDPRVVESIIKWIRKKNSDVQICVAEADASAMKTKYAFKMLGYQKMAQKNGVELLNLSKGEIVNKKIILEDKEISLPVNKILLDTDLLINVPTLKTHREIGFTCAMKNMFGSIAKPRKYSYHNDLSRIIVAINKLVKSDIVLVDGIIASGKTPKKMGVILTGDSAYLMDVLVSDLLGYGSSKVSYLKLAKKEGLGEMEKREIIEKSVKMREVKTNFPKPYYFLDELLWKSELSALKIYARIVGDVIPPILEGV
jgi:uncharacterized protein (DUF362 family)